MTEEEKRKRRSERMKNYAVILLIFLVLLPSSISILLVFQVAGLRRDVKGMQRQLQSWQKAEEQNVPDITIEDENALEDKAAADIAALENQLVWEETKQGEKSNSDSEIKKVYLTFDDGPSANTDKILDILNEYGVKATFFVCGKEQYTKQYQRIAEEGHTLGMHSYSHKFREIYESPEAFQEDMNMLHDFLYEVTGVDSRIVRFPGGSSNTICDADIMQELIAGLQKEGIAYFDWNVSSGDAAKNEVSAEKIASNVLDNVGRFKSSIVLMHDSSVKDTTVEALPMIIEKIMESENTVILPITQDTVPIQHVKAK